ncbi:hypothetical protein ACFWHR_03835 [Leucobacter sp. NPDC058333]|uniref:hypothetical protein n=1 Tax=Leucobacter sp. NPDC058333 TaxID=3346450 RepID=UPI00366542C4
MALSASFDFINWIPTVESRYIDLDAAYGAQCHDLWLAILYELGGQPGDGYAPDDDTVSVFNRFPYAPRLADLFTKHNGIEGIRAGDIAFWERNTWYPGSHTAIATGPPEGELLPVLTQNPGPVSRARLITRGLVGYLRPRTNLTAPNPAAAPTRKRLLMSQSVIASRGSGHVYIIDNRTIRHIQQTDSADLAAARYNPSGVVDQYRVADFNKMLLMNGIPLSVANDAAGARKGQYWHDGTWYKL